MLTYILALHIVGAIVSFALLGLLLRSTIRIEREMVVRYTTILAALIAFDGLTGVFLAVLSGAPALTACDNIAYYAMTFTLSILFSSWYLARKEKARLPVMRPLILGGVGPFAPALVAALLGL